MSVINQISYCKHVQIWTKAYKEQYENAEIKQTKAKHKEMFRKRKTWAPSGKNLSPNHTIRNCPLYE